MKHSISLLPILHLSALSIRALALQPMPSAELTEVTVLNCHLNTCPNISAVEHLHLLSQKTLVAYGYNAYTAALFAAELLHTYRTHLAAECLSYSLANTAEQDKGSKAA